MPRSTTRFGLTPVLGRAMESIANLMSTAEPWFWLSLGALLGFAFLADKSAKDLGLTLINPTHDTPKKDLSLSGLLKITASIALVLTVVFTLKQLDFLVTAATFFILCSYIWLTGYRSKIRVLQKAGLPATRNVALVSLFTLATSSLFVALSLSMWASRSAP